MNLKLFSRNKNVYKLLFMMIVLMFFFAALPVFAVEKQNVKTNKKIVEKSQKCWKHVSWVDRTTSVGDGKREPVYERSGLPVCVAFEKVLNATCESPDKLKCSWTLPPDEKQFKKLEWRQVNFAKYKNAVEEMILGKGPKWGWHQIDPAVKKAFDEGTMDVKMADADLDNDGKIEHVIRANWLPECPSYGDYAVVNLETKAIDWRYESLVGEFTAVKDGTEIMHYNGKTYMFGLDSTWKKVMVYEGYSLLPAMEGKGATNICRFEYLKGVKKK